MNLIQKSYHWLFPTYIHVLQRELRDCATVLEIGCGKGSPLKHIKKSFHAVGIDIHSPSIEESKKSGIHNEYFLGDIISMDFKGRTFDAVIALDLIEHLKKEDGKKLLKRMEDMAKKKVIIFTPSGFLKQDAIEGNKFQEHISGWDVEEMKKKGFEVYGINGWKPLRGERAKIMWKPSFFWETVSILSQPIAYYMPKTAFQIFCVKKIKNGGNKK